MFVIASGITTDINPINKSNRVINLNIDFIKSIS